MKRLLCLIFLLTSAACQAARTEPSTAKATPLEAAPVYVPAMCTLMGGEVRSEVPAGHPVIVMWGWSAAAEEQIEDYILSSSVVVTFDGVAVKGKQQDGIPFDESAKLYKAVWMANLGTAKLGIHTINYTLTFRKKIFDGFDYYGPGTENEKMEDLCEINVK